MAEIDKVNRRTFIKRGALVLGGVLAAGTAAFQAPRATEAAFANAPTVEAGSESKYNWEPRTYPGEQQAVANEERAKAEGWLESADEMFKKIEPSSLCENWKLFVEETQQGGAKLRLVPSFDNNTLGESIRNLPMSKTIVAKPGQPVSFIYFINTQVLANYPTSNIDTIVGISNVVEQKKLASNYPQDVLEMNAQSREFNLNIDNQARINSIQAYREIHGRLPELGIEPSQRYQGDIESPQASLRIEGNSF